MSYESHVVDIVTIQTGLADFWSSAHGWAPAEGASLLTSARLDWTPSLAVSLHRWSQPEQLSDGDLVLAWANLGSIIESSLRLFFGVYIDDYNNSAEDLAAIDALRKKGAKKGQHYPPDELAMEKIRQLISRRAIFPVAEQELIALAQSRRNAIHSFNDREIGTSETFRATVANYRLFIANMAYRFPYPDHLGFHWLELAATIRTSATRRART
ncbi:hypothetical protein [Rhizobium rhizogenes]|uniref:hypothetical protein n=1 Tax=Rhizobium rhizogenes TaxID=359 RepID=UPI0022C1B9E0|nr:hypothetical protein [Rhizobium rhizogenes]MCZ7454376.1 hypothetical protein [Rhizobium rhizogenes]